MFNSGRLLEEKRHGIIMVCLSGGQHIDAALEAADRLVPQSDIDKAKEEDDRWRSEWLKDSEEYHRPKDEFLKDNRITPWYSSALARWWPF